MNKNSYSGTIDNTGSETLARMAKANRFNHWQYEVIRECCIGRVLEIGSGLGNISTFLVNNHRLVSLADLRTDYCTRLEQLFSGNPNVEEIRQVDLIHPEFNEEYASWLGRFDSIVTLNVIEHIDDDDMAIRNCASLLRPGGRLLVLVPSYPFLFNRFDKELGHFRRYTKRNARNLLEENGFTVDQVKHFNAAGVPGWFIFGTLLNRKMIPEAELSIFDKFVPFFQVIDRICLRHFGLSVIVTGIKSS